MYCRPYALNLHHRITLFPEIANALQTCAYISLDNETKNIKKIIDWYCIPSKSCNICLLLLLDDYTAQHHEDYHKWNSTLVQLLELCTVAGRHKQRYLHAQEHSTLVLVELPFLVRAPCWLHKWNGCYEVYHSLFSEALQVGSSKNQICSILLISFHLCRQ